ncbi:MAG: MGMT family protein [Spirochaetaceae bacterium]|nr:MGMT family protein [Spirochaetaceae bacterium]
MTKETECIVKAIQAIPPGRVSSYRDLALTAGLRNGARQVARVLHTVSQSCRLPWYRVVKADGGIALRGAERELQIALLRAEGVEVTDGGYVDIKRYAV